MEKKYADIINEGKKNGESIEVINTKLKRGQPSIWTIR